MFTFLSLVAFSFSYAQENKVTGKVLDSQTKESLIGAVVMVKGTSNGTITDMDGYFSINAEIGDILTVTYVGYEAKEVTANSTVLNISLESKAEELDEVIVVGVRMKKSDLTGSVGNISSKQLQEVPTTDLLSTMQGRVPGLKISLSDATPGSDVTVRVRGNNSIHYGQAPVYVIDGVIVEEGLRMVNPDEIESVEVLKDASSTALYGSRASNGVIVITTKKGKKGEGKVNYRGFVTISSYQDKMKTLNSRQLLDLRTDAYANAYMDHNPTANREEYIKNYIWGTDKIFSEMELRNGMANNTSDWIDQLTRTGIEQNHALSFSGASDKDNYYIGFTYSKTDGVLKKSSYERMGGRINYERYIKPWLKVGTNTSISRGVKGKLDGNAYDTAMRGNRMQDIDTEKLYMYYQGTAQMGQYNPILTLDIDGKETHDRVLSTNYIEINPFIENLYIRTSLSADIYNKQDYTYVPSYVGQSVRDNHQGSAWHWRGQTKYYQWDNSISYETTISQKHRLFGMLSSSMSKNRTNNIDLSGKEFPTDMLGAMNVGMAQNKDNISIGSSYRTNTLMSFIARANYTYDNKYLLTATIRTDGSSKFAKDNRWGSFPSFSAAWVVSEEKFMSGTRNWLDQLKLRIGYGVLGNQAIPLYSYMFTYDPSLVINETAFVPSDNKTGNPDIKWEKQKQINIGIDGAFFNDRLSFSLDYFHIKNTDLLMDMSYWPSHGYDKTVANVGELENQGVEFSFNARILETKDLSFSIAGNIAKDKNKIKKLAGGVQQLFNGGNVQSREGNLFVGHSLNSLWAYQVDRLAQQSDMDLVNSWSYIQDDRIVRPGDLLPVDINNDGKIDTDDMKVFGNTDPNFYGGFSTNFRYKDFSLDAVFTYSYGAKRLSGMYEAFMDGTATGSPAHKDMLNRWTPENTNTSIPRAFRGDGESRFGYGNTTYGLLNASFLRLSSLGISYNLGNLIKLPFIDQISINAAANNLFVITPYKGYDPESGEGYPMTRSFTFGVNVSF